MSASQRALAWIALLAAPLAWAISTLVNYALSGRSCERIFIPIAHVTAFCLLLTIAAGLLSSFIWIMLSRSEEEARADRFVSITGALTALLFALPIALQGVAVLMLDACAR